MTVSINGTSGVTFSDASVQNTAATGFGFKNRIINGAMVIDQRNAGASVSAGSGNVYSLDRWRMLYSVDNKFTVQQQQNPTGISFSACVQLTASSAYSVGISDIFGIQQAVEGFNAADFKWGTSAASSVTVSFWVNSSLTGTFGGSISNSATNRSYPFSYVISAANTWEYKSVTIPGDTTGTWLTTNGVGLWLTFGIGGGSTYSGTSGAWTAAAKYTVTGATSVVGTNGATFYITGVQLEKSPTATSFAYRPYGTELALCQRYYQQSYDIGYAPGTPYATYSGSFVEGSIGAPNSTSLKSLTLKYTVPLRALPTFTPYDTAGTAGKVSTDNVGTYTAGQAYGIATYGTQSATIYMNNSVNCATLAFAYTVSAEL